MFFISHRGNINGPNPVDENKVQYINDCLDKNFDVEIDLWFKKNKFYLGHDEPQYEVGLDYLSNKKFWIHCKNLECFYELGKYDLNYFWHEKDKIVITSKGFFWNYPGTKLDRNKSINVLPERSKEFDNTLNFKGICSDYISKYKKIVEKN